MDGHAEPLPEQPARHGVAGGVDLGGAGALRRRRMRRILFAVALPLMALVTVSAAAQETPRHGGELVLVVPAEPPSYDAHREGTFALIHPAAPHYNTLLRIDPTDRTGTRIIGDLAESWSIADDGRTYTLRLRRGVRRSEEHTSELQSQFHLVCRLLLE